MSICGFCGATIIWADIAGQRVPLDPHEVVRGEKRYREENGAYRPVPEAVDVAALQDHRVTCSRGPH